MFILNHGETVDVEFAEDSGTQKKLVEMYGIEEFTVPFTYYVTAVDENEARNEVEVMLGDPEIWKINVIDDYTGENLNKDFNITVDEAIVEISGITEV